MINEHFKSIILKSTGAASLTEKETVQELWSGYGKIIRVSLTYASIPSAIIKHVQIPTSVNHPRGWNSDIGQERKIKSYQVETNWYLNYSQKSNARLPQCYAAQQEDQEVLLVLEDLDQAGFDLRKDSVQWEDVATVLKWLADFHASFLDQSPEGLWEEGSYWHLNTRPQELEVLNDLDLKNAAFTIDKKLRSSRFQTLIHGDAKLANFCFSEDGSVAGVDFQYVGGGCGMKDVAYFIGSCLNETDCERLEPLILDTYFEYLHLALGQVNQDLEKQWRPLYHVAWADFHRFLKGWSPGHWKLNSYSERITREVIKTLGR
ncbi:ecdysteroid 22-kinase family protein [Flavobacteriaceae bacterium]|nr:ecdysteroid 22-kinase family protein [Flavobacteriaceae bacterium]